MAAWWSMLYRHCGYGRTAESGRHLSGMKWQPEQDFPDQGENFPDRPIQFPARLQKIPCSDA
jgi:hypothetical protein